MSKVKAITLSSQIYLSRLSFILACVCAVSALLYGIFLLEAVAHAASQTNAQRSIKQISAQLADMEAQYLANSLSLTKEKAHELGYVLPEQVTTVFATAAASAISIRGN